MPEIGLPAEADDQVAVAQPAARRRAVRLERHHEHAGLGRQLVVAHDAPVQRHVLAGDADVAAPDAPVADQPAP